MCLNLSAEDVDPTNASQKIEEVCEDNYPFTDTPGYMAGGKEFRHTIRDKSGKEFSLTDFSGNVVIIVFYTTWCPNCPQVLQSIDNLNVRLNLSGIAGVKVIALNIGEESMETLESHHKSIGIQSLESYHSLPSNVINDINGVPACLIFDKKSNPVCGYLGYEDYGATEFISFIKRLAEQK
jgi:thiol-disulfide isomerase/thioredoxin